MGLISLMTMRMVSWSFFSCRVRGLPLGFVVRLMFQPSWFRLPSG